MEELLSQFKQLCVVTLANRGDPQKERSFCLKDLNSSYRKKLWCENNFVNFNHNSK